LISNYTITCSEHVILILSRSQLWYTKNSADKERKNTRRIFFNDEIGSRKWGSGEVGKQARSHPVIGRGAGIDLSFITNDGRETPQNG